MPGGPNSVNGPKSTGGGPWVPSEATASTGDTNTTKEAIQLSFQGANIDMVVQWLAETTGKTVIKHPQVQCQLTITSSKKVSPREAVNIVYRALAMEGFSAVETSGSIMIVPEGKEPRMTPEVVTGPLKDLPPGRQLFTKVFSLKNVQAADLKERIQSALSDKATINLDEHANQIILSDYNDNLRVVGELIEALDTDSPQSVAIRIINLKNMSAMELAKELAPLYQKAGSKGSKDTVDVAADERSNTLIVLSSEANFSALRRIVTMLDTDDAQEKTTSTFLLKNADASDVVKQLQELGQDKDNNSGRGRFFYFGQGQDDKSKTKMGLSADRRRNAVIVQAPPTQIANIRKMIEELDQPITDNGLAPKIYHLKYASATDIEDVLNELFLKKQQQRSYWDYFNDEGSDSGPGSDAGRLYGKLRITSDPFSNTLIVSSNSKENLAVLEDILNQLDQPSDAGEGTLHLRLKYAKASDIANSINILFAKNGSPALHPGAQPNQPQTPNPQNPQNGQQPSGYSTGFDLVAEVKEQGYYPWLGGQPDNPRSSDNRSGSRPVSDLVGRVRAVADERSNGVLVSANVHFLPQVLKLVDQLDAPTDQVLVETRIVEVSTDLLDQKGVRWSPDGSTFTAKDKDNGILAGTSGSYNTGFAGTTQINSGTNTMSSILTSLRSGVVNNSVSMEFLVQFLHENVRGTVLAEPQLYISDNETGRLFVGQQVPIPDNTQISTLGGQNTTLKYKDVGVVLEVTPHINSTGDVELKIHAESSTVVSGQVVLGGDVFDSRAFKTHLTAKNGQTLVLGGIIQKQVSETIRKTPILGDIPGLGWAFKKKDKETQEVELMVFLRPKIVRSQADAKELMRDIDKRTPLLRQWEEDADPPQLQKPGSKKKKAPSAPEPEAQPAPEPSTKGS